MKGHDVQPAVFIKLRGIGDDFLGQPFFHTGSDTTKSQEFGKFESTFDDTVQRMIHGDSIIPKSSRVSKFGGLSTKNRLEDPYKPHGGSG